MAMEGLIINLATIAAHIYRQTVYILTKAKYTEAIYNMHPACMCYIAIQIAYWYVIILILYIYIILYYIPLSWQSVLTCSIIIINYNFAAAAVMGALGGTTSPFVFFSWLPFFFRGHWVPPLWLPDLNIYCMYYYFYMLRSYIAL